MSIAEELRKIINTPIGGYIDRVIDQRLDAGCNRNHSFNSGFCWDYTPEGEGFWHAVYNLDYDEAWGMLNAKQKNTEVMSGDTRTD